MSDMENVRFTPPGPGRWVLDRSHYDGGTTPLLQELMTDSMGPALQPVFAELGVPADTVDCRWSNGFMYTRLRPLVSPDKPSAKAPPGFAVWLLSRVHPEFRRRNAAAEAALADSLVPGVIRAWEQETRPGFVARNHELGAVQFDTLDDEALGAHLRDVIDHCRATYREHFRLHAFDLGPIGLLIRDGEAWGLASNDVVAALVGASPSTAEPIDALAEIHGAVRAAGIDPATLSDLGQVRAASDEAATLLDAYLARRGNVVYAGYDIESPTLGEVPDVVLATIAATSRPAGDHAAVADEAADRLRARVPVAARDTFDERLAEARDSMDLRDANGPITVEWPTGLLRIAMLAWGRRLVANGVIDADESPARAAALVFELSLSEIQRGTRSGSVPSTEELVARRSARRAQRLLDPPRFLGPDEPSPDVGALPEGLRTLIEMTETVMAELGMDENADVGDPLEGTGVGDRSITGPARLADSAEDALDGLVPGEILVTRATSPAYNMVLTLVDGLVTADGGPMSHAAVLSRELGIPAVIGAPGVIDLIETGDIITVDPVAGRVTLA